MHAAQHSTAQHLARNVCIHSRVVGKAQTMHVNIQLHRLTSSDQLRHASDIKYGLSELGLYVWVTGT